MQTHALAATVEGGGGSGDIIAHEAYKDGLRADMGKPAASDPVLKEHIDYLYRENATIGSGSTAAAVREELATDQPVSGRFHSQKVETALSSLSAGCQTIRPIVQVIEQQRKT